MVIYTYSGTIVFKFTKKLINLLVALPFLFNVICGYEVPMKYFLVTCKCGHIGLGKYIEKTFPIVANSGKEAAKIARKKGRVKHHDKYAIRSVKTLTRDEYYEQVRIHKADEYFNVHSVQEQRIKCPEAYDQAKMEEELPSYRRNREKRRLVEQSRLKEIKKHKNYLNYE